MSEPRHLVAVSIDGAPPVVWPARYAAMVRRISKKMAYLDTVRAGAVELHFHGDTVGTIKLVQSWRANDELPESA